MKVFRLTVLVLGVSNNMWGNEQPSRALLSPSALFLVYYVHS